MLASTSTAHADGDGQLRCRSDPPRVGSKQELEQWMCALHNRVNRKLGKEQFNCEFVRSRWQPLDCDEQASCTLTGW
jgi:Erv1 / Alr family